MPLALEHTLVGPQTVENRLLSCLVMVDLMGARGSSRPHSSVGPVACTGHVRLRLFKRLGQLACRTHPAQTWPCLSSGSRVGVWNRRPPTVPRSNAADPSHGVC